MPSSMPPQPLLLKLSVYLLYSNTVKMSVINQTCHAVGCLCFCAVLSVNFHRWLPVEPLPTSFEISRDMTSSWLPEIRSYSFPLFCTHTCEFGQPLATQAAEVSFCPSPLCLIKMKSQNQLQNVTLCSSSTPNTHLPSLCPRLFQWSSLKAQEGTSLISGVSALCPFSWWTQVHGCTCNGIWQLWSALCNELF